MPPKTAASARPAAAAASASASAALPRSARASRGVKPKSISVDMQTDDDEEEPSIMIDESKEGQEDAYEPEEQEEEETAAPSRSRKRRRTSAPAQPAAPAAASAASASPAVAAHAHAEEEDSSDDDDEEESSDDDSDDDGCSSSSEEDDSDDEESDSDDDDSTAAAGASSPSSASSSRRGSFSSVSSTAPPLPPSLEPVAGGVDQYADVRARLRAMYETRKVGRVAIGRTWKARRKHIRALAKEYYRGEHFWRDNWHFASKRPINSQDDFNRLKDECRLSPEKFSDDERAFFAMVKNPYNARFYKQPIYAIRRYVRRDESSAVYFMTSPGKKKRTQQRPMITITVKGKCHVVTLASVLYRAAYPESKFTHGFHMSHREQCLGTIQRFGVAPWRMALESPEQNNIRSSCEARTHGLLLKRFNRAVERGINVTWEVLCFFIGEEAQEHVCKGHEGPLCIYEFDHPHRDVLYPQLLVEMAKPGRSKEEKEEHWRAARTMGPAACVAKAQKKHRGLELTGEKMGNGIQNEWRCTRCGHTGAVNNLKKAGHGEDCKRPPEENLSALELEKKTGFKVLDEKIGTNFKRQCIPCGKSGQESRLKDPTYHNPVHGLECKRAPVDRYKPPDWGVEMQAQAQIQVQVKEDDGFEKTGKTVCDHKEVRCKRCGATGQKSNLKKGRPPHGLECKRPPEAGYKPPAVEEGQVPADDEMKENDGGGGGGADDMQE